jgi:hypothetical protein
MLQPLNSHASSPLVFRCLKISIGRLCNAACAHCSVDCGPWRREALEPGTILSCIDEAAKLGMSRIELTGGEPLLRAKELPGFVERARGHGLETLIYTNAFWAKTPDLARRRLAELHERGLTAVTFSTDRFHQEFIPISCVGNAIEACNELGITASVIVTYLDDEPSFLETVAVLHQHTSQIYLQSVAPFGRAAAGLSQERMARWPFSKAAAPCPGTIPAVAPDGRVTLCCAPPLYMPVDIARISPLVLGWIDHEPLSQIVLRAQENPFIQLLVAGGVGAVLARIEELQPGLFEPRPEGYFGLCDLCMQVLGSEPVLSRIRPLLPAVAAVA